MKRGTHLPGCDTGHRRLIGTRDRRWRPVLARFWRSDRAPTDGALSSHRIHRLVVNEREQPGGKAAPRWLESGRIAPQRQEHLLHHILSQPLVRTAAAGQRAARPTAAL